VPGADRYESEQEQLAYAEVAPEPANAEVADDDTRCWVTSAAVRARSRGLRRR
jgi:hypothetical protein